MWEFGAGEDKGQGAEPAGKLSPWRIIPSTCGSGSAQPQIQGLPGVLCFFQRDEHKNLSVASRDDCLISLTCLGDTLGCQQHSNAGLGLGLQSRAVGIMLGCFHVPVKVKAARDLVNKSTTKAWILLFLGSCCCPHRHVAQVPRSEFPHASWPVDSCMQKT